MGPGGRPSIGPVSPVCPPTRSGSSGCCVWLDCAVGAGDNVETGLRGNTSKRGIGWLKGATPKVGLGGNPVGMLPLPPPPPPPPCLSGATAAALRANGLSAPTGASTLAVLNSPHFISSRREVRGTACSRSCGSDSSGKGVPLLDVSPSIALSLTLVMSEYRLMSEYRQRRYDTID